ncbi:MAG: HXXEE domain-containing protein [Bacteroidales bacterium]|jgi:hypothetical protein|nr:HXXEE domain-containing protein [Bacteroidales bacterium]
MDILRKHWYDIGSVFAIALLIYIFINFNYFTHYQLLMCLSLVSLFFHQFEEYRIVGTFPGMINKVMYKSEIPDRYPLNPNTAFCINVIIGWFTYILAAIFAEKMIWLGLATILISFGNVVAHTFVFNFKGKTFFNAGLATSWLVLFPCVIFFFYIIHTEKLVSLSDYLIGIPLGIVLNVVGILKLIDWMANKNTTYIFEQRNLLKKDRK